MTSENPDLEPESNKTDHIYADFDDEEGENGEDDDGIANCHSAIETC